MKKLVIIGLIGALAWNGREAAADPIPWEGDIIVVTGQRMNTNNLLCVGAGCSSYLHAIGRDHALDGLLFSNPLSAAGSGSLPDFTFDREKFCEELEESRPHGCSSTRPPPVPGLGSGWRANGCGVGGWRDSALTLLARLALSNFTGDLDVPFPGVSFLGACNEHDRCYGLQAPKHACDSRFLFDMRQACSANTANATMTLCNSTAAAYFVSVTEHGDDAYESAGEELDCAQWHQAMEASGCRST